MHRYIITLFALLIFNTILSAQDNHMDLMTTMTGEHDFAEMGWAMTTLDWNGDGYDDLIINERQWNPDGFPFTHNTSGKLNIYFGGLNFDNIPEMEIPGHHEIEFSHTSSMCNAGDMNGDGIDDLALFRATMYENNHDQQYDLQLCVYYGGANPDTIPDFVLTFPREEFDNDTYCHVSSLGDINYDGFDDLGYIIGKAGFYDPYRFGIIYGESMTNTTFMDTGNRQDAASFCGLGDVNGDGFDDFCMGYLFGSYENNYHRIMIYFGNSTGVYSDSLLIGEGSDIKNSFSYPAGDVSGDGHADFVSSFSNSNAKLYFGGPGFDGTNYVNITPPYYGDSAGEGFGYGDVNGNGTDDLMGTFCSQSNGYGDAYLWIGGNIMNPNPDFHIIPPELPWPAMIESEMFGWCLTMGDYNGDGYCDAAISAPFDYAAFPEPGHVFVYAGNSLLAEPIQDDFVTPVVFSMHLYPNPLQPKNSSLNVRFTPLNPPSGRGDVTFEIYNIRGQKVKSFVINAEQTKSGSASYNLNGLSSGVYVCVLTNEKQQIKGKITIIK
jgi:hypothetical protein